MSPVDNTIPPDPPVYDDPSLADQAVLAMWPWMTPDLEVYVRAFVSMLDEVELLAFEQDEFEGWSLVMDPDRARPPDLSWLAQFVGERLRSGLSEPAAREWLRDQPNSRRGTLESIVRVAQRTLTGSRLVVVEEREPDEDTVLVQTKTSETPNQALVESDLRRDAIPADIVLEYNTIVGQAYANVVSGWATYDALKAAFADYNEVASAVPSGTSYTRPPPV